MTLTPLVCRFTCHLTCIGLLLMALASSASAQDGSARYSVSVELAWEPTVQDGPKSPHWSRLIAIAHSDRFSLFADGDTASSGLALVATNGRVNVIEAELAEAQRRGRVGAYVVLPGIDTGSGSFRFEIEVSDRHDQLSFATMLAPSPDWFSGINGVALFENNTWRDDIEEPLWVWDAGADTGADFTSPNAPGQPRQSVRLLTHPAFLQREGLRPIGFIRMQRIQSQ